MLSYLARVSATLAWHTCVGEPAPSGEPFRIQKRAWPWLCDAYLHINNAGYLRLAEDSRWAWTARTPLLKQALAKRWKFIVGGTDILYRRSIPLMSSFEVLSSLAGADERWLYFVQDFVLPDGKIACRALIRATVRDSRGTVNPTEVARIAGVVIQPEHGEAIERMKALSETQLASVG